MSRAVRRPSASPSTSRRRPPAARRPALGPAAPVACGAAGSATAARRSRPGRTGVGNCARAANRRSVSAHSCPASTRVTSLVQGSLPTGSTPAPAPRSGAGGCQRHSSTVPAAIAKTASNRAIRQTVSSSAAPTSPRRTSSTAKRPCGAPAW